MNRRRLFILLAASLAAAVASAPPRDAHACFDEAELDAMRLTGLVRRHYAALQARDAAAVTSLWGPEATYTFDHRGCCPPPRLPARPTLLASLRERGAVSVEAIDAPAVRGDEASVTARFRVGDARYVEHFAARRVRGAWVLTAVTRSRA